MHVCNGLANGLGDVIVVDCRAEGLINKVKIISIFLLVIKIVTLRNLALLKHSNINDVVSISMKTFFSEKSKAFGICLIYNK